jgi:FlaA1/EpsC-like NDP-sugar epimerase
VSRLHRTLGQARGGVDYRFLGALAPSQDGIDVPVLGSVEELPRVLESYDVDELIVTDSDLDSEQLSSLSDEAYRNGLKVRIAAKTTDVLTQRVEFVPGQGVPLFELRPSSGASTSSSARWCSSSACPCGSRSRPR